MKIIFKGKPLELAGRQIKEGVPAPDFKVAAQDLSQARLSDFQDKIRVLNSFPSIDTPVCDMQVKEFNKKAAGLSENSLIIGISKDLPFAQRRFCESFEIKNVRVFSDYKDSSFGLNYGLLIKELGLLARSVMIVDLSGVVRYFQLVAELATPPDFQAALDALAEVVKNPFSTVKKEALPEHCRPCEGGVPPLPKDKIEKLLAGYRGWSLVEDKKLVKEFKFKDFSETKFFLDTVCVIAEEQGHHPAMTVSYNKLKLTLTTHAIGGLSENDFIMAKIIDELGAQA